MDLQYDLESVPGVAIGIAEGPLDLAQITRGVTEMWKHVDVEDARILWDLQAARFDLSPDQMRELADFIKSTSPLVQLRMAFVVSQDLAFGLLRMFEVFRAAPDTQTSVFRDRTAALQWVKDDGT